LQFSSIIVMARPGSATLVAGVLSALPGIEIFARDESTGRFVVLQEAPDAGAHEEGFRHIQSLPGVAGAWLVSHAIDDEGDPA
jgi:nitrate reductase NapAB chaperone NapD